MIGFTVDIDWAGEKLIEDTLSIFHEYQVPCTVFCTHSSRVINSVDRSLFEIGLHPNFNPVMFSKENKTVVQVLDEIASLYPEAKGIRSHSMAQSSRLLNLFHDIGLEYDCNQFLPYNYDLKPYMCWTGLKRIPYSWEDDIHFEYGKSFDYDILSNYTKEKLIIMDFHPIHIFLNTYSSDHYNYCKKFYSDPQQLLRLRNNSVLGTRDFLIKTLERIKELNIKPRKLGEISED